MKYLPARSTARRLFAAAAAAVAAGTVATAACAASSSPAAHAASVIPTCTGTTIGAWIAVSQGSEASGTTYYPLEFTNIGRRTCSLSGYPVVSAISRAGVRLGSPAGRGRLTVAPRVVLAPGATAHTTLAYHGRLVSTGGRCGPVEGAFELRVYLAGQKRATYAAFGFQACSHAGPVYLTITEPIRAGVGTNKG
jgi:Protein of unknown function (DUF4232)